jgi:hypothetical protein
MTEELLIGLLLYGVFPLWLAAGFADYCCHRVTRIERTSGRAESSLHAIQYLQVVAGITLSLFLEVTSLVLVLVIALAVLHLATGYLDIAYTTGRRYISPPEQHVHSYMEVLPLVATAVLAILYWSPLAAIFTGDGASWTVARRQQPLPLGVAIAVAVGMAAAGLAIAEEYFRCVRALASVPEAEARSRSAGDRRRGDRCSRFSRFAASRVLQRVHHALEPTAITVDHGTELASKILDEWCYLTVLGSTSSGQGSRLKKRDDRVVQRKAEG